jgi:hypothetical protein
MNSIRSKIQFVILWAAAVAAVTGGSYFLGWHAQERYDRYEERKAPLSEEEVLQQQGRYDDAVQVVLHRENAYGAHPSDDSSIANIYLRRAQADPPNRERWAEQAAFYIAKAYRTTPTSILSLEEEMDDFNRLGDYSDHGCPDYEKAIAAGESALPKLQGNTFKVEGHSESYPAETERSGVQSRLKRIQSKIDAWCKKPN